MKNILMITPFFAPYSHAAVYRAHRFAKYLPRFGWKPYVLTVDRSFLYFIDNALLDDLPMEVEIIRARHIDLSYSGLKSLFEKPIGDSRLIKGSTSSDLTVELQQEKKKNLIKDMIDKFREGFIFIPDRYITWYPFALKKAKEIIEKENIDVIYSTFFPFTPHLIAMKLKEQFKTPWLADFREGGVEEVRGGFYATRFKYRISSMIEKRIMEKADLLLMFSESTRDLFLSKYDEIIKNKVACIKTGVDVEIFGKTKQSEKNKKFTIVFTGEFQQAYSRRLFEFLKIIFERKLFERSNVEVLIIGAIKRNIFLKTEIEFLGLADVAKLVDYLSLSDYFSALLSADATFLPSILKYTLPIKIVDYLFVKKPIITFEPSDEARIMLEKSGLGVFMPDEIEAAIQVLLDLLRGNYKFKVNEDYINQFTAYNQSKQLADILLALTREGK